MRTLLLFVTFLVFERLHLFFPAKFNEIRGEFFISPPKISAKI